MPQPTAIRVNGRVISINYRAQKHMPDATGYFRPDQSRIEIAKGQEAQELRDTILHEVLHALLHTQGREYGGEIEEMYVRAIATGLLGVMQDNPELTLWLIQHPLTPQ